MAALMLSSADTLMKAGADFLICPDNTFHQAFNQVAPQSPLPVCILPMWLQQALPNVASAAWA